MFTMTVSSLSEYVTMYVTEMHCKRLDFRLKGKSCDLNETGKHAHPKDYGPKAGFIYMDVSESSKSCAVIQQEWPQVESEYHWITIGSREVQVYCDMTNNGKPQTLVMTISSKSNDHLQGVEVHCFKPTLCVPFVEKNNIIEARKLGDEDVHKMMHFEGKLTFRVDVLEKDVSYTVFYQILSGQEKFNSTCAYRTCPRIIISHSYPYQWETNNCTNIDVGYRINTGCHRVFDEHDDAECDYKWHSSKWFHQMPFGIRRLINKIALALKLCALCNCAYSHVRSYASTESLPVKTVCRDVSSSFPYFCHFMLSKDRKMWSFDLPNKRPPLICSCDVRYDCLYLNFRFKDMSHDLNDAGTHAHPKDYGPKAGFIYKDVSESPKI
ncbi:unnamed protein product [Pocillopora meandrina]|uniref:Uncharacterized protein n=1 Tax=Pocillopora meandrina TaxID=46732 RepID=A0AAU9VNW1_9CNID|nr:unnamed protein product [Pocillopora meandrina]